MHDPTQLKGTLRRRDVLRLGVACGGAAVLPSGARASLRRDGRGAGRDTLVVVFMRGGHDGLSLCVPTGDSDYYAQRPTIAVPASETLPLDGFFGLNRAAQDLLPLYQGGQLAFVHACGLPHPSRSHFEATRRVEEASVIGGAIGSGWIGRFMGEALRLGTAHGRGIAIDRVLPQSLQTAPETVCIPKLADFSFAGPAATQSARAARLDAMYDVRPEVERNGGKTGLSFLSRLASVDFTGRTPSGGAVYPSDRFGAGLYEAASLIKAQAEIEVIEIDSGGWDDHSSLGPVTGEYAARIARLSAGLRAFLADLGPDADRTTVLVQTEFGRRVDENGSGGIDHGRAGLAMVLGGSQVAGGSVYRTWPGLDAAALDDGAVVVTTDIREVYAEILVKRLQATPAALASALPGFSYLGGVGALT